MQLVAPIQKQDGYVPSNLQFCLPPPARETLAVVVQRGRNIVGGVAKTCTLTPKEPYKPVRFSGAATGKGAPKGNEH